MALVQDLACPNSFNTLELTENIKGAGQTYEPNQRIWLKVKHRTRTQPTTVVAGLRFGDQLRIVGRSTVLSAKTGRELGERCDRLQGNIRGLRKSAKAPWTDSAKRSAGTPSSPFDTPEIQGILRRALGI